MPETQIANKDDLKSISKLKDRYFRTTNRKEQDGIILAIGHILERNEEPRSNEDEDFLELYREIKRREFSSTDLWAFTAISFSASVLATII